MTQVQPPPLLPGSAQWMLKSVEGELRTVAAQIVQRLLERLPALSDRRSSQKDDAVFTAVYSASVHFVDVMLGREAPYLVIDDHFRKLGYRAGAFGRDRALIEQAVQLATGDLGDELRKRAADNELSAAALNALNEAMAGYADHLVQQVRAGYDAGAAERDQDSGVARSRLVELLLNDGDPAEIELQAGVAGWELPDWVTVMAVEAGKGQEWIADTLDVAALARRNRKGPHIVLCPDGRADEVVAQIQAHHRRSLVAVCWPVPLADVSSAWRWVNRALHLVRSKVIPRRPVIDCGAHRTEIWLHGEPVLRRQLAQELLEPLFTETENSREILSETLLVWLETRDSAPAIAAKLGVHPQTVRYRWKRINELFGDSLHDPDFVTQLLLVLKASVPLWIAGDQSDFQRFASRRAAEEAQVGEESAGGVDADG